MNALETILKHPIAATIVMGSLVGGVARIIGVAKGEKVEPLLSIKIGKLKSEEE